MAKRYYFHGDEHETRKGVHYCAYCDTFEPEFEQHRYTKHKENNDYERYMRQKKREANFIRNGFTRPASADKTNPVA